MLYLLLANLLALLLILDYHKFHLLLSEKQTQPSPHHYSKLTLEDLGLTEGQLDKLSHTSKETRVALLDACQILYLTADGDVNRAAAKRTKEYFRQITLGENNKLNSDKKPQESILESTAAYFAKP